MLGDNMSFPGTALSEAFSTEFTLKFPLAQMDLLEVFLHLILVDELLAAHRTQARVSRYAAGNTGVSRYAAQKPGVSRTVARKYGVALVVSMYSFQVGSLKMRKLTYE